MLGHCVRRAPISMTCSGDFGTSAPVCRHSTGVVLRTRSRRTTARLVAVVIAALLSVVGCTAQTSGQPQLPGASTTPGGRPGPRTDHPRLLVTSSDVPRLRSWATDANPIYKDGLAAYATR